MLSNISIIDETDDFIVINKPAGVVATPGPGHAFEDTVAGWLMSHVGDSLKTVGLDDRWGIVHRLDKQTSGVMVCAKTAEMYEHLVHQFRERLVSKQYVTLVWGDVGLTLAQKMKHKIGIRTEDMQRSKEFVVNAPIARHPKGISTFIIDPTGKPAATKFLVSHTGKIAIQKELYTVSLLHAFPKTGRTHQIRVHAKAFGHPVFADSTYQTKNQNILAAKVLYRQFLHAAKLSFVNLDRKQLTYSAALPQELQSCLEQSRITYTVE